MLTSLIVLAGIVVVVMIAQSVGYYFYAMKNSSKLRLNTAQFKLSLSSGKLRVWTYDVYDRVISFFDSDMKLQNSIPLIDYLHYLTPESAEIIKKNLRDLLSNQYDQVAIGSFSSERYLDGDQHVFFMRAGVLDRDETGRPSILYGISKDITDTFEQREKNRAIQLRRQAAFNTPNMCIAYLDKNMKYRSVNKAWLDFMGIDKASMVENVLSYSDIWGKEKASNIDLRNTHTDTEKCDFRILSKNTPVIGKTSGEYTILHRIVPVFGTNGEYVGFNSTFVDFTEKYLFMEKTREYMEKAKKAKEEVERYAQDISKHLPESKAKLLWFKSEDMSLVTSYDFLSPVKSYTRDEWLGCMNPDSRTKGLRIVDRWAKYLRGENTEETYEEIKNTHLRLMSNLTGQDRYYEVSLMPDVLSSQDSTNLFGLYRDVTEQVEQQKILEEKRKEANEMNKIKDMFLKNMSFEVRTPLQSVVGYSELLRESHDKKDSKFFIEQIQENSTKLLDIINDVLLLSKLDAHMVEFKRIPTDYSIIVRNACDLVRQKFRDKGLDLITDIEKDCVINLDSTYVKKIFDKLIDNAYRFTNKGYVKVTLKYEDGNLVLMVEDTGVGMSQEELTKVYSRFSKSSNDDRGTGLGLSYCKEIVSQLNGHIDLQSVKNEGTTCIVSIPCERIGETKA